ncbi:MAG: WYL domain-containing protein [Dehalococcoidales bacterium]|nr:WYL domain-containing protein [Dehalococcoidales bacterium]
MRNSESLSKSIRLTQLQYYLHKYPQGLTSHELAEYTGVCLRTIQRDLLDLQNELGIPITQQGNKYGILESYTLPPVTFSLYEAMALFLTSRLALRLTDENNPHMQQALVKVSQILPAPVGERLESGIKLMSEKVMNTEFLKVYEKVALAWITQRQLKMQYLSSGSDESKEWILNPYFVEMTGTGYSMYVIGQAWREGKEGIITFKLDRIKEIEVMNTTFEIPETFDIEDLLSNSWGIMWGENTEIKLKFSRGVTRRVKESIWHPSQSIEELPGGGCIMTLRIGNTLEITPWIRGWGPDVEVLEPNELREKFTDYAIETVKMYQSE